MDVAATPTATPTTTPTNAVVETKEETSSSALASDFETFLRLLTTQLENQDPSKPLDSTEFVAQLASFSAVEQQINTNTKLDQLISQVNGTMTSDLSKWIGADVKSNAAVAFTGAPVDVFYSIPQSANLAQLVVRNGTGAEVDRRAVDITSTEIRWDGLDTSFNPLPDGTYTFELEAFENATSLGSQPAQTFSAVKETRLNDGAIELVFGDGSKILAGDVTAVRGG